MVKPKEQFDPVKYAQVYSPRDVEWTRLLKLPTTLVSGRRAHYEKHQEVVTYYVLDASNKSVRRWCD